ncbi:hypothetical protein CPLU01_15492 [Colletotrichum plurivorum]|uniref:Uncharacterized protein n=1 Tax=Colletotrichum plurivorum TaxID=2175906 RepID=A0A8H6JBG1_9PEZI|nr:hypothetical protein CPLU01_15492 [Colletotrichum plurivorum]
MQAEKSALLPLNNAHQLFRSPGRSAGKGQSIEAFISPLAQEVPPIEPSSSSDITPKSLRSSPVQSSLAALAALRRTRGVFSFPSRERRAFPQIPIVDGPSSLSRRFSTTPLPTTAIPHGLTLFTSPGNASTFDASPLVLAFDLPASYPDPDLSRRTVPRTHLHRSPGPRPPRFAPPPFSGHSHLVNPFNFLRSLLSPGPVDQS